MIDIYVVGTGTIPVHQTTKEAEVALASCRKIFYVDKAYGVEDYLRTLCEDVVDLHPIAYEVNRDRLGSYNKMASIVVDAALDGGPIGFALYGHPLIYAYPPFLILAAAELLGLKVKILPGISSLDTMFVDLKLDPATQGLQMYEATDVLLRERPLQSDVPCLIWQIGTVESRLFTTSKNKPERFDRIREYLLRYYPADHMIASVTSATHPLAGSIIKSFKLSEIADNAEVLHQGCTVFIPPICVRPVKDMEFLREIDSADHSKAITVDA